MNRLHVVIVNPFDPLPWESDRRGRYGMLAAELIQRGYLVTWLTADYRHATKTYRQFNAQPGSSAMQIVGLHVSAYSGNISLARVVSHRQYARQLKSALVNTASRAPIDIVIASIPPIESALCAMQFCRANGCCGVIDMQDAWPGVLEFAFPRFVRGVFTRAILSPWYRDIKRAVDLASSFVAVSPEYLQYLISFRTVADQKEWAVFPLGFDDSLLVPTVAPKASEGPFTVCYIGTFGRSYDLETVVRAANICRKSEIQFILIGTGPTHSRVKRLADSFKLDNVQFLGPMSFGTAIQRLQNSDVGLVPYIAGFLPNITNKVFDYLFLGLPLVSSIGGSLREIIQSEKLGVLYEAGNPQSLSDVLLKLNADRAAVLEMRQHARRYAEVAASGKRIYAGYADFLERLAERSNCISAGEGE